MYANRFSALIHVLSCGFACLGLVCFGSALVLAQEKEVEKKVTFEDDIKPIFREHCTACHSESDKESDLALDTYGATLTGGSSGEVIKEGNSGASRLFALIAHTERPYMPPDSDPIPKEQIALVKTWIEQGMPENSGSKIKRFNNAAAAMLGNVSLGKPEGPPPMPKAMLRQPVVETDRAAAISAMAASPWAPLIAVGGQFQVSLYHAENGQLLGIIPFPEGEPQSLTFTRDGKQLLIGGGRHSHSGCAVLVDIESGRRITKVGDELDIVLAADISPDKSRIAIAGPQKMVRIFDSVSGDLIVEMKKHTDWIFALRYSPDGILLASGDRSYGLVVWEAETGRLYSELTGHRAEIRALDFRADSNVLASASLDGTIKLWDMFESKEIKSWNAHGGGATSINFAHDGSIASSGRDARVKLWDGNGKMLKEFKGLSDAALEVALTGDGNFVAGGDWSGRVQLWPAADPAKNVMIAANPPSIEKRVAATQTLLAEKEALFNNANGAASAAATASESAMAQFQQQQTALTQLNQQVAAKTNSQATLQKKVASVDGQIQALEKQLAELRATRQATVGELATVTKDLTGLNGKVKEITSAAEASKAKLAQLSKVAQEQAAARDAAKAVWESAKRDFDQAKADQVALEEQAKQLKVVYDAAQQKMGNLTTELAAVQKANEASSANADKLAQELAALKKQLAELSKRVDDVASAQQTAQANLVAERQKAETLQKTLETATQAALEAEENLQLFENSYKRPQ